MLTSLESFPGLTELKTDLKQLIISTCHVKDLSPEEIDDNDYLINGKGKLRIESIDAVDIVVSVERRYGVKIKDLSSAREHMRSVHSLAAHIYSHRKAGT